MIIHYTLRMPKGKPRRKTAVMTLRIEPQVKAVAELAAEHDRRSVTSLIEVLVVGARLKVPSDAR